MKIWNMNEMTYVETLFGHADVITAIDAISPERAVSCGLDRSVRYWKVPEETQLVFHGHKGPIDCVRMINHQSFITGSQDGSLCLWNTSRKKPVAVAKHAHSAPTRSGGCDWITSLGVVRYADLALSGAADGYLRFWKSDADDGLLESVWSVPLPGASQNWQHPRWRTRDLRFTAPAQAFSTPSRSPRGRDGLPSSPEVTNIGWASGSRSVTRASTGLPSCPSRRLCTPRSRTLQTCPSKVQVS